MGKITVIGIGPGSLDDMTLRAHKAIEKADTIAGYNTYIKLIEPLLAGKKIIGTGMMQEIDRCTMALAEACKGHDVAVVSSGDAGVYGMAGLVLELLLQKPAEERPQVAIIPGVSAVNAAAAILGAPLMHDFAVISLSDLLTPWDLIKKRAAFAAQGDFVIALYNPKSRKRVEHIEEIREILLKYKPANTPVGIVRGATRNNESVVISDLANFTKEEIDMFSLVIIGNSNTYSKNNLMITPRGYKL
ncbi:precorrin-3B C(17)-methyltransferase [Pectinatus cerevisiiphilus]|uniref:Cobalt-precorrin 3 C17-methyltransferase n=1 Tax=Pectinatus cerevisiiphilus TaxID=86956 RepID=A0A4R3K3N3_9FIRM|nr:precorrin-3B C(17)-methyltransferase [Pectinatus cerevisiiphilus]TCS77251.1 cobalt-precorrin 3 C17-methyltransferase [Pectinatus cerevisiiphilus]